MEARLYPPLHNPNQANGEHTADRAEKGFIGIFSTPQFSHLLLGFSSIEAGQTHFHLGKSDYSAISIFRVIDNIGITIEETAHALFD